VWAETASAIEAVAGHDAGRILGATAARLYDLDDPSPAQGAASGAAD
jgi:hypothetical protein